MSKAAQPATRRQPRKAWRWWLLVVLVAAVLIGARAGEQEDAEAWAAVERRDLVMSVPIEGELEAVDSALVGPPQMLTSVWQYKISFLAPEGKTIEKGQPVLGFDVTELEESIDRMMVAAPRSGTVIMKTDWRNNKKKMGDQVWRGAKVLEIPDLSRMRAEGEVSEADAGRLKVGQTAMLRLDAYPELEYQARVARIRRTVQRKSWRNPLKIVKVVLEIETTDTERMRPGMRFRGEVEFGRQKDTLVVPVAAVSPTAGGSWVATKTLFGERQVMPSFGERNDEYFEVLSGLAEGDQVRVAGSAASGEDG